MMAAARTARNTMAPTAAPQQMQHQYDAFPSPSSANFDHSPGAPQSFTQINTLNLAYYETFYNRLIVHISTIHGLEEKCSTLNQHFGYFQQQALDEIHRLKIETLLSQGLPTGKRRSDDTDGDYSSGSSPDTKKVKNERVDSCEADSPEEEVNVKGSWRCLYYEEDPETHFHCKEKRYKRVSELRRHIKTHTLPHYCAECGYRTAEERRLQNHKCEPGNRKKYSPVSEEDRLKHEQLARMGIKVGHMRMILFGKKGEADEFANGVDDDTASSEHDGHSRRPSFSMPHQQVQQTAMNSGYAPGYPQFQSNPMNMSQAPQPMYTATHAPQQMMHPSTHTPPFNPSSPINSPPQQLGHAAWYYHGHHQQDTNDFILYPPGTFPPQSPPSVGGPIGSDHSSSPPGHSPPGHYTTAHNISPYQQQHIPYSSAEHAIIPGVARVDSLNSFLQEVFPDVPRSRAVMDEPYTEITEDRPRAMPSSEIAEMNRNMALQEAEQTRSLNETLSTRPSFLVRVKLNRLEMAERGKSFLRSWSLRAPNQESLPPTEPPRHDDGRPSFWKRFSAPARLAGVEPVMSAAREPESQNDGPVLGGIKRILSFGLTRPKSAVSAVDKTPAAKPPIENSATAKINSMAADPDAETAAKPPVDADVAAKPLVAAEPPTITTAATSIPTPPNSP